MEAVPPVRVDHLVYAAQDLAEGMDSIERLLGTRPTVGGRHPRFGTHNALLSLGPATYLEVIAPDPTLSRPPHGFPFGLDSGGAGLRTWAVRSSDLQVTVDRLTAIGIGLGAVESGERQRPDGTKLSWRLTDPRAMPFDGVFPFLIDWGDSPHPGLSVPLVGRLESVRIQHTQSSLIADGLRLLGASVEVRQGPVTRLVARIDTRRGLVELS